MNMKAMSIFFAGIVACMLCNWNFCDGSSKKKVTGFVAASDDESSSSLNIGTTRELFGVEILGESIQRRKKEKGAIVVGVAGGSGSGKTTLAKAIVDALGEDNITYLSHDHYYRDLSHLNISEREKNNFDHPDSLETELMIEHLKQLKSHEAVRIPKYDFNTHSRIGNQELVYPRSIILVEGILIFTDPILLSLFDIKIFVDTDSDIRIIRRIQRDRVDRGRSADHVISQYLQTVRPMHMQFVEPSKRNADIIVPEGLNIVALDILISRLKLSLADVSP